MLDLKMPICDGFDFLAWKKTKPSLVYLPTIVMTSSDLPRDVRRSYELGANSYLVKPVVFDEMVHLVQRFESYWTEINRTPTTPALAEPLRTETSFG